MEEYTIYQNSIRHLSATINELGWTKACEQYPRVHTHLETTFRGSKAWRPEMFRHYRVVARILARDLEEVFQVSNIGPEYRIRRLDAMHSISVGDVIRDSSGRFFMVDDFGFSEISTLTESAA